MICYVDSCMPVFQEQETKWNEMHLASLLCTHVCKKKMRISVKKRGEWEENGKEKAIIISECNEQAVRRKISSDGKKEKKRNCMTFFFFFSSFFSLMLIPRVFQSYPCPYAHVQPEMLVRKEKNVKKMVNDSARPCRLPDWQKKNECLRKWIAVESGFSNILYTPIHEELHDSVHFGRFPPRKPNSTARRIGLMKQNNNENKKPLTMT